MWRSTGNLPASWSADRLTQQCRQYLSLAHTERLEVAGVKPSTGAVGSSHDNALAESVIGLYKTELVKTRRPWRGFDDLEIATAEWVDWYNHRRPFEYCDDLTPVEAETVSPVETCSVKISTSQSTP